MRKVTKTPKSSGRKRQAESGRRNLLKFREGNSRPAMAHGIHTLIASAGATLPPVPGASEVREQVSGLIDAAIQDLGGKDAVTSTQRQILEAQRLALTIVALGARYLATEGIVSARTGKPQSLLAVLATYCNTIRLNAETLGLSRKAKDALTLEAVAREYAETETHDA